MRGGGGGGIRAHSRPFTGSPVFTAAVRQSRGLASRALFADESARTRLFRRSGADAAQMDVARTTLRGQYTGRDADSVRPLFRPSVSAPSK